VGGVAFSLPAVERSMREIELRKRQNQRKEKMTMSHELKQIGRYLLRKKQLQDLSLGCITGIVQFVDVMALNVSFSFFALRIFIEDMSKFDC
jgi:hypothetical protein